MATQCPALVLVRRQGTTSLVDCRPEMGDALRGDILPLVQALGAVLDTSERDWGILVIHIGEPCLDCPRREARDVRPEP